MKRFMLVLCLLVAGFLVSCGDDDDDYYTSSSFPNTEVQQNIIATLKGMDINSDEARIEVVYDDERDVTCWVAREAFHGGLGVGISCLPNSLLGPQ